LKERIAELEATTSSVKPILRQSDGNNRPQGILTPSKKIKKIPINENPLDDERMNRIKTLVKIYSWALTDWKNPISHHHIVSTITDNLDGGKSHQPMNFKLGNWLKLNAEKLFI